MTEQRPAAVVPAELARAELAPLWRAAHDRLSAGRRVTSVTVGPLEEEERAALADLLGLDRLPPAVVSVRLSRLDEILGQAVALSVRDVVEQLVGPVADRAGQRVAAAADRAALWSWISGHPVVTAQPALHGWVVDVRRMGLLDRSVAATRSSLDSALAVLARLPAGGVPLPAFAESVLGDPHALDDGTRLSGLVLRALATLYDVPVPTAADARRQLWQRAGVSDDELSAQVLVGGLRPAGADPLSSVLRIWAAAGQACAVTAGQLRGSAGLRVAAGPVRIVENPSVLAMALRRFGAGCPPLVCTAGWPSGACVALLRMLGQTGASLRYHGDFDGDGVRIAAYVMAKTGARPWRMSAADYLDALACSAGGGDTAPAAPRRLGRVTEAPWDPELADAMRRHDRVVYEERVAHHLLADLGQDLAR